MQKHVLRDHTGGPVKPGSVQLDSPLNEQVYQRLKWALIIGDYKPGAALSIRGIAGEFGISMMPVREALKRLVSERALTLTSSTKRSFRVATLAPKRISDLFFVRSCLEGIATELATQLLTTPQIDRLAELAEQMDDSIECDDMREYLSRNYEFHFTIYTGAGNAELVSVTESLWAQAGPFLADGVRTVGLTRDWQRMHSEVAGAIRVRDSARARQLIEQDINWGTQVFRDMAVESGAPESL
ncbi:MAG: GntR family transcriptional regulator [Alphaproteobacteria bacterium]